jgi:hypothetical protein
MPIPATSRLSFLGAKALARPLLVGLALCAAFSTGVAAGRETALPAGAPENVATGHDDGRTQEAIPGIGSRHLYLPLGGLEGGLDLCSTWVAVQNIGDQPSKALLLMWSEHVDPGGMAVPPDGLLCSGLLRPGASWEWRDIGYPGMASGALFSFTAKTFSDLPSTMGIDGSGSGSNGTNGDDIGDDIVADRMCDVLLSEVVGDDSGGYERFHQAFTEGLSFAGIPMHTAVGAPLAAQAMRDGPGDETPGVRATAAYEALGAYRLGAPDPHFGVYEYHATPFYRARAGMTSTIHIQNAGHEDATVEIWTRPANRCGGDALCLTVPVTPGATASIEAADCIPENDHAALWLSSTGPIAAVMSVRGRDSLAAHAAAPIGTTVDVNGNAMPVETRFSASGPLVYDNAHGWSTAVDVQNLSSTLWADVEVVFLDRGGAEIQAQIGYMCPRGVGTFMLTASSLQWGTRVGSVRVSSLPPPGDPSGARSQIAAVALSARKAELGSDEVLEYASYRLQDGPAPLPGTSTSSGEGAGAVAIPHIAKDLDRTGLRAPPSTSTSSRWASSTRASGAALSSRRLIGSTCL